MNLKRELERNEARISEEFKREISEELRARDFEESVPTFFGECEVEFSVRFSYFITLIILTKIRFPITFYVHLQGTPVTKY